jgi:hypothetical protein
MKNPPVLGEAGPDLGVPQALAGGFRLPIDGDACLLGQPGPTLGVSTSQEKRYTLA